MPEDTIKGLAERGIRGPLRARQLAFLHREPTEAGFGEEPRDVGEEFQRAIAQQVRPGTVRVFHRSDWVSELAMRGVTVEAMLDEVRQRVLDDPHDETLVEAMMIANDIGRMPGGPEVLGRYLTPEFAERLTSEPPRGGDR